MPLPHRVYQTARATVTLHWCPLVRKSPGDSTRGPRRACDSTVSYDQSCLRLSGGSSSTSVLRAFRLLRILKLAKTLKSLRILLATVMEAATNVLSMTFLFFLFIFMFAVLGMQCM